MNATTARKGTLSRLTRLVLSEYKFSFLAVMVCIVASALASLASTLFTRTLIDEYIVPLVGVNNPSFAPLARRLLALAAVLAAGTLCSYLQSRLMARISQGTLYTLRTRMFRHMQSLPVAYFDTHAHGDIMSRYTNDVDNLRKMIGHSLQQVFNSLITLTATLVSMVVLSIPLSVVSIAMALLMAVATTWLGKRSRRHFKDQQDKLAQMNGYIEEMITGQKVVKVFNHEDEAIVNFEQIDEQLRNSTDNANRIANIVMPVNGNLAQLSYVLLAVAGATLALTGVADLSLGTLVAFLTLNRSFSRPIANLSQQVNSVLNAAVGAERVFALMDEPSETDEGTVELTCAAQNDDKTLLLPVVQRTGLWAWHIPASPGGKPRFVRVDGGIEFTGVDFGYTSDKTVLHDINIQAMPEQKIAFVGGTGAGKTTITNLINRFYDLQGGSITIDGIDVASIKKPHLRRAMAMVLQDTHLFTGTVLDNIRYGRLDATDQDCIEAAKLSNADNFIRRLSNGYHTVLRGGGSNLSQGERQLLAIARAAVAALPILILDEATSSIDTRTERLVQQGMDSLMKGRTTLVIAHRLSTVRNADCIIVLDHGRIIEHGTHDQLMALHGTYHHLYTGHDLG